jgi:hypothetical protein
MTISINSLFRVLKEGVNDYPAFADLAWKSAI